MSIKEGLTFWDLAVLKTMRATARGKVTLTYKLVRCALVQSEEGVFVLEDIQRAKVEEKHSILRMNFNDFLQIHVSYVYSRMPVEETEAEAEALSNKDDYVPEVHEEVSAMTRLFNISI